MSETDEGYDPGDEITVSIDRFATGGLGIGSAADGRIVLASGAIPGETALVKLNKVHKNRLEGSVTEVTKESPDRRTPECIHVAEGCGGCDLQHIKDQRQSELKAEIVADCLKRITKLDDPIVDIAPPLDPVKYRTTIRCAVVNGVASFRKRNSHDLVHPQSCLTAHPLLEELIVDGHFGQAKEVTLRIGVSTGERVAVLHPSTKGAILPDDVVVTSTNQLKTKKARPRFYHEIVAGKRLRISAGSFFQCRLDGAELLVSQVSNALGLDSTKSSAKLLDAYCGVGLFGATLGHGHEVIGVESNSLAASDAEKNYKSSDRVESKPFERWRSEPVDLAVADPARIGLKEPACEILAQARPSTIALVSCDPASMARDVSLLSDRGYKLDRITLVDIFRNTSHVETVAKLTSR